VRQRVAPAPRVKQAIGRVTQLLEREPTPEGDPDKLVKDLKQIGWEGIGVIRSENSLTRCLESLEEVKRNRIPKLFAPGIRKLRTALEAEYMLISHEITARSALARAESRGTHYREDFPEIDNDRYLKNFVIHRSGDEMQTGEASIPVTRVPLPKGNHRSFSDPGAQSSRPQTIRGGHLIWLKEEVPVG
jgi:succinate dehydrogenase/fumarate reductase flavoprotein subunit